MPNFKKMHRFVAFVNKYNTKDNEEDDATLNNLVDENYYALKAIKEDNALRKFKDKFKYDSIEVARIYREAKELGFLKRVSSDEHTHVSGVAVFVEFKGLEFIHKSRFLGLPTGRLVAWINYYNKPLIIVVSLIGAAFLATSIMSLSSLSGSFRISRQNRRAG